VKRDEKNFADGQNLSLWKKRKSREGLQTKKRATPKNKGNRENRGHLKKNIQDSISNTGKNNGLLTRPKKNGERKVAAGLPKTNKTKKNERD